VEVLMMTAAVEVLMMTVAAEVLMMTAAVEVLTVHPPAVPTMTMTAVDLIAEAAAVMTVTVEEASTAAAMTGTTIDVATSSRILAPFRNSYELFLSSTSPLALSCCFLMYISV
jgi:hypothetical protein